MPADPLEAIDWDALGATLRPHDAWGIRTLVYRSDNTIQEHWTPVRTSDMDVRAAVNGADAYALLGFEGAYAALGVTTPLGDLPLDVRVWRDTATSRNRTISWRHLAVTGMTPTGDPSTRLLRLPAEWTDGKGWPPGSYQVDVLLESGVLHIHVWIDGNPGPVPQSPTPRSALTDGQLRAMASTPGGFIVSGMDTAPHLFSGLGPSAGPHEEWAAWVGLGADHIVWAPWLYDPQPPLVGTASVLGVALPEGQAFASARLTQIAPVIADFGPADLLPAPRTPADQSNVLAVFRPADPAVGLTSAVYRIDGVVQTDNGLVNMSWDMPMLTRPTSTVSMLLAANRAWPNLPTGGWTVLAPGHRAKVVPTRLEKLPPDPGDRCRGGAQLGSSPWYLGIVHPGEPFDMVTVRGLNGEARGASVAVQVSQLVDGFATIRPVGSDWLPGRYGIWMHSGEDIQRITVCVQ